MEQEAIINQEKKEEVSEWVGVVVAVTGDKELKVALISDILRLKEKLKQ